MKNFRLLYIILFIFLFSFISFAEDELLKGYKNSYALCIGINDYQEFPKLNYATEDAKKMKAAFEEFGFKEVRLLLNEQATEKNILKELEWLKDVTDKDDRVVIYFAGHGQTEMGTRGDIGYIVPFDSPRENYNLYSIPISTIKEKSKVIPAKHILYLMDSCYSGTGLISARTDEEYYEEMTEESVVYMITGGKAGEKTIETEGNGLFTKYLLKGLEGAADYDRNNLITGSELGAYVKRWVTVKAKDYNTSQTPQVGRLDGDGEIIFDLTIKRKIVIKENIKEEKKEDENKSSEIIMKLQEEQKKAEEEKETLLKENVKLEQVIEEKTRIIREEEDKYRYNPPVNFYITTGGGFGDSLETKYLSLETTIRTGKNIRSGVGYSLAKLQSGDDFQYSPGKKTNSLNESEDNTGTFYGIVQKIDGINDANTIKSYSVKLGILEDETNSIYLSLNTARHKYDKVGFYYDLYFDVYNIPEHKDYYKEYHLFLWYLGVRAGINIF